MLPTPDNVTLADSDIAIKREYEYFGIPFDNKFLKNRYIDAYTTTILMFQKNVPLVSFSKFKPNNVFYRLPADITNINWIEVSNGSIGSIGLK